METENAKLSFMQPFLRRIHEDRLNGNKSFIYGKSTSNQVNAYVLYLCQ